MSELEALAKGLTEMQRELLRLAKAPATARELSALLGGLNGHKIGHFARRSKLFEVERHTGNWCAVWKLTPLGLALRALIERTAP